MWHYYYYGQNFFKGYLPSIIFYNLRRSYEIMIRLAWIRVTLDFKGVISCLPSLPCHLFFEFWMSSLPNSNGLYPIRLMIILIGKMIQSPLFASLVGFHIHSTIPWYPCIQSTDIFETASAITKIFFHLINWLS